MAVSVGLKKTDWTLDKQLDAAMVGQGKFRRRRSKFQRGREKEESIVPNFSMEKTIWKSLSFINPECKKHTPRFVGYSSFRM